jgi:hypothetical protein
MNEFTVSSDGRLDGRFALVEVALGADVACVVVVVCGFLGAVVCATAKPASKSRMAVKMYELRFMHSFRKYGTGRDAE